jgi:thiamine pyrophosphokinase
VGRQYLVTAIANETAVFSPSATGTLSVFALNEATGVSLQGLQYNLDNGTLSPDFPLGVSNHFVGKRSEISVENGSLLVMYERKNGLPKR